MGFADQSEKVEKKSSRKKKDGRGEEETGCWVKLRFMGSCMSSRSRVDNSLSGRTGTHYGNLLFPCSFIILIKDIYKYNLVIKKIFLGTNIFRKR